MTEKIAFRCDASFELGCGDVVSSIRLAEACQIAGLSPVLICKDTAVVRELVSAAGIDCDYLPEDIPLVSELNSASPQQTQR